MTTTRLSHMTATLLSHPVPIDVLPTLSSLLPHAGASNGLAGAKQVDLERTQDELLDDVHQRIRKAKVDGGLVPPNPARGEQDCNMPMLTEMGQVWLSQQSLPSP